MIFIDNKYTRWYYNIVNAAKARHTNTGYTERHHIIPDSLGGDNTSNNLVDLTAHEHFVCHLLLPKMLVGEDKSKMIYAAWQMANQQNQHQNRFTVSGRTYSLLREEFSKIHAIRMKTNHPLKNPIHKEAHRLSIIKRGPTSVKGAKRSEATKEKFRNTVWTDKAIENRLNNCLKAAQERKGTNWSETHRQAREDSYYAKNENHAKLIFELVDSSKISINKIAKQVGIDWTTVKTILKNRNEFENRSKK
jgi:hypothetical protein